MAKRNLIKAKQNKQETTEKAIQETTEKTTTGKLPRDKYGRDGLPKKSLRLDFESNALLSELSYELEETKQDIVQDMIAKYANEILTPRNFEKVKRAIEKAEKKALAEKQKKQ